MHHKKRKGYIVKVKGGGMVVLMADNIKEAREYFHKVHHGTIKTIRASKKKRD